MRTPLAQRPGFRGLTRTIAGVAVAVASVAMPMWGGGGVAHADGQTLTASTATGAHMVLGQPIQITVTVKSDTLISGSIVVQGDSSPASEYRVEVPAGSTKELTIVGMPLQYIQEGYSIIWFDETGKSLAETNIRSSLRSGDTVVGLFPSLGTDFPERIPQPTETDSFLFTIPDEQLELPAAAFTMYDVIIATNDDLTRLDGDLLASFRSWLAGGGRLVVDDGDEGSVADVLGLDEPSDRYGNGEVDVVSGSARTDRLEEVTRPVAARSTTNLGPIAWMGSGSIGAESMTQGLVEYTGDPLIGSAWLYLLVLVYALLVGPLMFVAFRRRRRALWVVGPLIAVAVCSVIWLDSARRRSSIEDAHGTVINVRPVGSGTTSSEMLYVRSTGEVALTLPPAYTAGFDYESWSAQRVELGPDGTKLSRFAERGSFAVYNGSGPASEFDGQVAGTADVADDAVTGTITNRLAVDLHQVAVMWNGNAQNIGDIPAGETVEYSLDKSNRVVDMVALRVWGDSFQNSDWWGFEVPKSGQPRPEVVSPAVWDLAVQADPSIGTTQSVDVVGWTEELKSPLTGASSGTSAVITRLEPDREATEGDSAFVYATDAMDANSWSADALIRLDAPASGDQLALTLSRTWGEPELLVGGEWVELAGHDADDSISIPPDVLDDRDGIYLRARINLDRVQGSSLALPVLRQTGSTEQTVPLDDLIDDPAATESGSS